MIRQWVSKNDVIMHSIPAIVLVSAIGLRMARTKHLSMTLVLSCAKGTGDTRIISVHSFLLFHTCNSVVPLKGFLLRSNSYYKTENDSMTERQQTDRHTHTEKETDRIWERVNADVTLGFGCQLHIAKCHLRNEPQLRSHVDQILQWAYLWRILLIVHVEGTSPQWGGITLWQGDPGLFKNAKEAGTCKWVSQEPRKPGRNVSPQFLFHVSASVPALTSLSKRLWSVSQTQPFCRVFLSQQQNEVEDLGTPLSSACPAPLESPIHSMCIDLIMVWIKTWSLILCLEGSRCM